MAGPIGAPKHVAGAATTDIPCSVFLRLIINTPATGAITISDGTPGTTIAIINTGTLANADPYSCEYGCSIVTGNLRVVTQASQDVTIVTG